MDYSNCCLLNKLVNLTGSSLTANCFAVLSMTVCLLCGKGTLIADRLVINEVVSNNETSLTDFAGDFPDWIELYNGTESDISLAGYRLTDNPTDLARGWLGQAVVPAGGFLVVFASDKMQPANVDEWHVDFRINSVGETIYLFDSDGALVDRIALGPMDGDEATGREPDGKSNWFMADLPSPAKRNEYAKAKPYLEMPEFSVQGGLYSEAQTVKITNAPKFGSIRYTLDGRVPDRGSKRYTGPITVARPTTIRARSFGIVSGESRTRTFTYLVGREHDLPVVSISVDPNRMFSPTIGIYSKGASASNRFPYYGANFWKDKELPANVTLFEMDGTTAFNLDVGLKIFGGWTKGYPQKSLAVFLRRKYGAGSLDYRLFPERKIESYESFVLRNSGNDNPGSHHVSTYFTNGNYTMFRDGLMHRLLEGEDFETQAYRPAAVYINGKYYGLYNLREKMNEHFIASHHAVDPDKLDIIESHSSIVKGSLKDYSAMIRYLERETRFTASLKDKPYRHMQTLMDTGNFITHQVSVAYFQNFDIGNIKCWKERDVGARWRWMLFDQDYGFNLWKPAKYIPAMRRDYSDYENMFDFLTESGSSREWPNGPKRTFLLRTLLRNDTFRNDFINRTADLLNSRFLPETVLAKINSMQEVIRSEMPINLKRWRGKMADWEKHIDVMRDFARERPAKLRRHLSDHFKLSDHRMITIYNSHPSRGVVRVNSITIDRMQWSGVYFDDVPVKLTAQPERGFRFMGWSGGINSGESDISINPRLVQAVSARFEPIESNAPKVLISEINYHSESNRDPGDWLELHNPGSVDVSLAGWTLTDEGDQAPLELVGNLIIPAGGYVVFTRNPATFKEVFPGITPLDTFAFGLGNGGDQLFLYDSDGALVDHVEYDDKSPWPSEADGDGYTLERGADSRWDASANRLGTPGEVNGAGFAQTRLNLANPALDTEGNLVLKASAKDGYIVESSTDLRIWDPVGATIVRDGHLLIPLSPKLGQQYFFRLKAKP